MEDILAVILIFGGGTLVALAMSPIGRAIGARISGQAVSGSSDELKSLKEGQDSLAAELDGARQDIAELQERLDFTERMLARHRDDPALPPESLPRK